MTKRRKARTWYLIFDSDGIQWGEVLEDHKDSLEQLEAHNRIGPCELVKVREVLPAKKKSKRKVK